MCKRTSILNEFMMLKTLGTGFSSKVKLAFNSNDQKYYAIKIINSKNLQLNKQIALKENKILRTLDHPNIIKLIDYQQDQIYEKANGIKKQINYSIIEYGPHGVLFDYIFYTKYFSESISRFYFQSLISALKYCHSKGIAHRDIKLENMVLDEQFNLKIIDFGFASIKENNENKWNKTKVGTQGYIAPEIYLNQQYKAEAIDVFAAGISLFILRTSALPFNKAKANDQIYQFIANKQYDKFWDFHQNNQFANFFSENFKDLLNQMLDMNPNTRITLKQIQKHPWYLAQIPQLKQIQNELKIRYDIIEKQLEKEKWKSIKQQQEREFEYPQQFIS